MPKITKSGGDFMVNFADEKVRFDMTTTARQFEDIVIPFMQNKSCNGEWISCEGLSHLEDNNKLKQMFDLYCGIDWFYINNKNRVYGYAVRIQPGKDWGTFTIRKSRKSGTKTEFDKLTKARDKGAVMPKYHLQCYLDNDDNVLAIYRVKTSDLLDYIEDGYAEEKCTYDGTKFYVCKVDGLKDEGYKVMEVRG